jgi:hypothetical protein
MKFCYNAVVKLLSAALYGTLGLGFDSRTSHIFVTEKQFVKLNCLVGARQIRGIKVDRYGAGNITLLCVKTVYSIWTITQFP